MAVGQIEMTMSTTTGPKTPVTLATITAELGVIAREKAGKQCALADLRAARAAALTDPSKTTAAIIKLDETICEAEIELERLSTVQHSFEGRLEAAEVAERIAEAVALWANAAKEAAAFIAAYENYEHHALAIVEIVKLQQAAIRARQDAWQHPMSVQGKAMTTQPDLPVFFSRSIVLPSSVPGQGMLWGVPAPAEPQSPYRGNVHYY
jgi:hypothetical protein